MEAEVVKDQVSDHGEGSKPTWYCTLQKYLVEVARSGTYLIVSIDFLDEIAATPEAKVESVAT